MWGRRIKLSGLCKFFACVFLGFLFMLWDAHETLWEGVGTIHCGGEYLVLFVLFYLRNEIPLDISVHFLLFLGMNRGEGRGSGGGDGGCCWM